MKSRKKLVLRGFAFMILALLGFGLVYVPGVETGRIQNPPEFKSIAEAITYVTANENSFPKMKPQNEKAFITESEPTPLGFVYIPGFSASRSEISPVVETLGTDFKANVFFSRLTGHGQDAEAFAHIQPEDFISDGLETMAISKVLAHKRVWVATSTGALVALWMAERFPDQISALVLISPAFDIKPPSSRFLAGPFGHLVRKIAVGPYRQWNPQNPIVTQYWNTKYRSEALVSLARFVSWSKALKLEAIHIPVLMLYTPKDDVVEASSIEHRFNELGSSVKELVTVSEATDHVLTGAIVSPQTTARVTTKIKSWLSSLNLVAQ